MIVGVPLEVKEGEERVALTPSGAKALAARGHDVRGLNVKAGAIVHPVVREVFKRD